ncbi:MAG: alanine racemase [Rikenellaceae bacterium]
MRYLLSEIAQICGGQLVGSDRIVESLLTDSRCSGGGEQTLFVAIKGQNHDSHLFVSDMSRRGVNAFMVERQTAVDQCASFVIVESSLVALQRLAAHHRSYFKGKVVALVGSNGKTVVKEWVAQSYSGEGVMFRSPRSYNSQLGVALSLLMCSGDEDVVLIEAGISRCGEMQLLERMIRPDVVLVTSIGDAHQEGFNSLEQKVVEKMRMATNAKVVIYHSDYAPLKQYFENKPYTYILMDAAELCGGKFADITSKRNSQIVEALLDECGCQSYNLDAFTPVAMRLEVKEGLNDSVVVNDSYNSCVNSLSIALDMLNSVAAGRPTTLILSPILQSGVAPERLYADVAKVIEAASVDRVICVGENIDKWLDCSYYASTEELLAKISREDYAGRAILLKGNRGSRFERVSHALERRSHTTRLEVNLDAMVANLNHFRRQIAQGAKLVAMVKASSYGAGDYEVAQTLQNQGVDYLAVAFVDEGAALRERGITMPIIVLNADDDSFEPMIQMQMEPEIYSLRSLRLFVEALERNGECNYPIHIKLDTGMHRLGFDSSEVDALCTELSAAKDRVRVASIFSHLSCADEPQAEQFTLDQVALFDNISSRISSALGYVPMRHIANSAAIERFPLAHADACRLGIGLYGFGSGEGDGEHELTPIATLKSRIVQIKRHAAGTKIGYGAAGELLRDSAIATVPIGYADGLRRELGCGRWSMLLDGRPAPIVGRVCMDSVMIDVTDIASACEGDDVTIFSPQEGNRASDMAEILGTIPYEILTSVSKRVKRVYLKE